MTREEHDEIATLINEGYLAKNLKPLKCTNCESERLDIRVTDRINGHAMEKIAECKECGRLMGYWVTGNWQV